MKKSETTKHLKRLDKAIDAAKSYRKSVRKLAGSRLSADHVEGLEARVDFDIRLLRKERDRIAAADGDPAGTEPEPDVAAASVAEPAPAAADTGTPVADDTPAPPAAPAAKPARAPRARRAAGARTKPAAKARPG